MGIFSSKKKTYVASVVYNMAGPEENRPNYLKSIVLGTLLTKEPNGQLGESVVAAYTQGPGLNFRRFFNWASTNYKLVGIPVDTYHTANSFSEAVISNEIYDRYGYPAIINWIEAGRTDVTYWARSWIYENASEMSETAWTADYIDETGEVLINFPDGSFTAFTPNGYLKTHNYLYVSFSQVLEDGTWLAPQMLIYRIGSGSPALDAQYGATQMGGRYFPYIPVRYESKFISPNYMPELYKASKKAYKKALGGKFDELVDQLKNNKSIDDIDFAYVSFGVLLNVKETVGKKYLYDFFKRLESSQAYDDSDFDNWENSTVAYESDVDTWESWYEANKGLPVEEQAPMPTRPALPAMPSNTIRIRKAGPANTNYDMEITWSSIRETIHTGLGKPGAKKGELWFTLSNNQEISINSYSTLERGLMRKQDVILYYQDTATSHRKLRLSNLVHKNHIYNGKFVEITAWEALSDEDDSGFLVPLENSVFREMSLVDATQLATCCSHLVLNSYQIVKKKWYQRGIFKVFVFIAAVVLTVVTGGFGAASIGLLGANAAVGAAIGFTPMYSA